MIIQIIDKLLQLNLFTITTGFIVNKIGILKLSCLVNSVTSREEITQNALMISAVTGAIYGVYKVGKIIYDLFKKKNKK